MSNPATRSNITSMTASIPVPRRGVRETFAAALLVEPLLPANRTTYSSDIEPGLSPFGGHR
jgi:hypothetical protein